MGASAVSRIDLCLEVVLHLYHTRTRAMAVQRAGGRVLRDVALIHRLPAIHDILLAQWQLCTWYLRVLPGAVRPSLRKVGWKQRRAPASHRRWPLGPYRTCAQHIRLPRLHSISRRVHTAYPGRGRGQGPRGMMGKGRPG